MTTDDNRDITGFWTHCGAGMHMGRMEPRPLVGEFDAVLTVAKDPGRVDREIPHRHLPISYMSIDVDQVWDAIHWVEAQFDANRKILVRSEGGLQRPGLIIASTFVKLGASPSEALYSVRRKNHNAITDWRYIHFVNHLYTALRE